MHKRTRYGVEYYGAVNGNGTNWFNSADERDTWLHNAGIDNFYLIDGRTPDEIMAEIDSQKIAKRTIELDLKEQYAVLMEKLAKKLGVSVGDKVAVDTGEIVYISKFFIGSSRKFRYGATFENKSDKEMAAEGITRYALHAECFASKKDGSKSMKKSPEHNRYTLEYCEKVD